MNIKAQHNRMFHLMAKPSSFHCNIKCEYCFYLEKEKFLPDSRSASKGEKAGRHHDYMNDAVLEAYIKNYIESNEAAQVNFAWQGGEPTLLGLDFYRKAVKLQQQYANGKMITNSFQTNGIMLNHKWCDFFRDHGFLVGISVDGLRTVHDHYRVFANNAPTFKHIKRAIDLLLAHEVEFNSLTVVNDRNWDKGRDTYLALKELGVRFMQFIPIVESNIGDQTGAKDGADGGGKAARVTNFSVPPHGYGQFLLDIFDQWVKNDVGRIFVNEFFTLIASCLNSPSNPSIFSKTLCNFINSLFLYIGIIIGTTLLPYFSLSIASVSLYLDFSLSILFMNIIFGMFSVNSNDFSVPTWTSVVASITIIAASLALRDDITSPQKSK